MGHTESLVLLYSALGSIHYLIFATGYTCALVWDGEQAGECGSSGASGGCQ